MVRRLLCLLWIELQLGVDQVCFDASLQGSGGEMTAEEVRRIVKEMENAGSRYKNLEQALGSGIVFVLGRDLPENQ
jgi:hypothetical protein